VEGWPKHTRGAVSEAFGAWEIGVNLATCSVMGHPAQTLLLTWRVSRVAGIVPALKGRGRVDRGVNALHIARGMTAIYGRFYLLRPFMAESLSLVLCEAA